MFFDIRLLIQSQLFSSLLGVVIGGSITFAATAYSIKKQFKHQEKLNRNAQVKENRRALVTIREELLHNGIINIKSVEMMDHGGGREHGITMPKGWLEFRFIEWNTYKSIFLLATDDEELITKISWLYYQFFVCNTTRILTREIAAQIEEELSEVVQKINNLLGALDLQDNL